MNLSRAKKTHSYLLEKHLIYKDGEKKMDDNKNLKDACNKAIEILAQSHACMREVLSGISGKHSYMYGIISEEDKTDCYEKNCEDCLRKAFERKFNITL
jgi:hypothetical protein